MSEIYSLPSQKLSPQAVPVSSDELKAARCKTVFGCHWLKEGFLNFTRNPGNWSIALIFTMLLVGVSAIFPIVGVPVVLVVLPVLLGGLMLGCHQLWQQRNFHSRYLFAGFETHQKQLLKLGVIQLLVLTSAALFAVLAAAIAAIGHLENLIFTSSAEEFINMVGNTSQLNIAAAIGAGVFLIMLVFWVCGSWLSPALVVLGQVSPWKAFRASIRGCLKNVLPLLWMNCIALLLLAALFMPLALLAWVLPSFTFGGLLFAAIFLVLLLPAIIVSMYCTTRDVFPNLELGCDALISQPLQ